MPQDWFSQFEPVKPKQDDWFNQFSPAPEPVSTGKSHGPILDSIWNFLTTPLAEEVNVPAGSTKSRVPAEIFNQFIRPVSSPLGAMTAGLAGPAGRTLGSIAPNVLRGGLGLLGGASAIDAANTGRRIYDEGLDAEKGVRLAGGLAGSTALAPAMGLRGLLKGPRVDVLPPENISGRMLSGRVGQYPPAPIGPQQQRMLPGAPQPTGYLPAFGETSNVGINTPTRFNQGIAGVADANMQYPWQMQPALPPQNARNVSFPNATQPVPGGKLPAVTIKRPGVYTPDTGPEIAAQSHNLILDPLASNNVFGALLPNRMQQGQIVPTTPMMVNKPTGFPNQINHPPVGPRTHPGQVLPQYGSELPRGVVSTRPPTVNPDVAIEYTLRTAAKQPIKNVTPATKPSIGMTTQIIGAGKATASSLDLSAPLRQGINLVHKKEWRDAIVPMVKSWASEKNFKELEASIQANPRYKLGQEAGLGITDRITNPEDVFISTLPEKIPYLGELFKQSNRAYTGFLNKLRQDTFTSLVDAAEKAEPGIVNNLVRMKEIASFVNNATGRGSLGKLEKNSQLLNNIFFSPRFVSSRVQMMNPANYLSKNVSEQVRKEYLKSFLATSAFASTALGLSKLAGADVDVSNPTTSDFLKAKFGNTRLDPWGGYQQYLVAGMRMLDYGAALVQDMFTGSDRTQKEFGTFKKPSAWETSKRFAEGKFNPVVSFTTAMMNGREFNGVPFEVKSSIAQHFTPMVARDLVELFQDDPSLLKLAGMGTAANFGMGVQTYRK